MTTHESAGASLRVTQLIAGVLLGVGFLALMNTATWPFGLIITLSGAVALSAAAACFHAPSRWVGLGVLATFACAVVLVLAVVVIIDASGGGLS